MNRANFLKENEKNIQKKWGKITFESNAIESTEKSKNKFFVTFPFPYANGHGHLGHVFTMLKADVMARHHLTKGYNVLFPYGFHATGIPISAAANRLKDELANKHGTQYETMVKMDIPETEIPNFTDPKFWIKYFPKIALDVDLPLLGCAIDYRRSFITTDANPYFDSFVRWQFNRLNEKGYLKFGKKLVIYSQKDNQPCSEADRSIGEDVDIRELKVAFVPCITGGYYVTYDPSAPDDDIIKSKKLNLSEYHLKISDTVNENYKQYFDEHSIKRATISVYMPINFYQNYSKQPTYADDKFVWAGTKVRNDVLPQIMVDVFSNVNVCDLAHGTGIYTSNSNLDWKPYYEPEAEVISRSGDKCIVAETEQWYIMYDEPKWLESVYNHVESKVKFTDPVIRELMLTTIKQSHPWPFSRTFGLGTRIPFDEKYLIDSLSDSTIYMAYYTVAHLIENIPSNKLCDDVWNTIFFGTDTTIGAEYPELFNKMCTEFKYWYPVDLRVSGKDLVTNHLIMMFFNHMAIFGADLMPRMIYANGHIMVNGEKMSKSKGNFITLRQAVEKYGVDVTRMIASCAGDDSNDGSFNESEVDNCVLAMYAEVQNWSKFNFNGQRTGELEFVDHLAMVSLNKIVNLVEQAYKDMRFRDIVKYGFYELQTIRNKYENPHRDVFKAFLQAELAIMAPIIPHWVEYMSETHNIPTKWPEIMVDPMYDNPKTDWIYNYCQIIQSKIGTKIKKYEKKHKWTTCKVTINNDIQDYFDRIMKYDTTDKEQRKQLLSNYKQKTQTMTALELITHLERFGSQFKKLDIGDWLCGDNSIILKSYLTIKYPGHIFEVAYSNTKQGDPFNPQIEFSN